MKVDFRFSAEGDLELGSPSYDKFGQLLYVDAGGELSTDSSEGELVRDIPLQVSTNVDKQIIIIRLKTDNPDWYIHPEIGGDLSELIGLPNTRETGQLGTQLIENSLCGDGFISVHELDVRAVPISHTEILFHISLKRKTGVLVVPIIYDLEHGLMTEYEVKS